MDANAYLKRHGWRGDGHSLDTTNRGIRKPLLVSKKIDVLGVGLNKHAAVSDQWWMRAFDEGLKNLGTDKKSTLSTVRTHGIHLGGLYGRFVKGETVEGTIGSGSVSEDDRVMALGGEVLGQKRKREDTSEDKRAKRKVEESSAKAKKLRKSIDRKVKIVVQEAGQRGLISGSSKKTKPGSALPTEVDEVTLVKIFERAGLSAPANSEEGSKAAAKQDKYVRQKSQRELKRVAQSHFESQLSASDRKQLHDDDQAKEARKAAKGEEKAVDKYKRKAEKSIARAAKANDKKAKSKARAETSEGMSAKKLAKYQERAAAKGISIEDYIRQKRQKDSDVEMGEDGGVTSQGLEFTVDTTGDSNLKAAAETPLPDQKGFHVLNPDGSIRYTVVADQPVPQDPSIWDRVDIKALPKAVREARRAYMEGKRKARKSAKGEHSTLDRKQKKYKERREHARNLLMDSRRAAKKGGEGGEEKARFPLIPVTSTGGDFTKEESAIARRTVRKVLKEEKKEKKAEGESWKKSKKIKGPKNAAMREGHSAKQQK